MSDHIDGPRQIGDPASDLTDLFAFTSPENPAHTVLAANVFPSAGVTALFSNAVNHSIAVRRVTVAGLGNDAKFQAGDQEYRFSCRFTTLERGADSKLVQRGILTCPGGQELHFVVNDEKRGFDTGWEVPSVRRPAFRSVFTCLGWVEEGS